MLTFCLLVHHVVPKRLIYVVCGQNWTSVHVASSFNKLKVKQPLNVNMSVGKSVSENYNIDFFYLVIDFIFLPAVNFQCSKTCGRGLRKRSVFCSSTDPGATAVVVPDSMCRQHHKPKAQETCVLRRCPKNERLQWFPAPWGEVGQK